jgi:hypothetical protein
MVPLERGTDGGAESLDLAEVDPPSEAGLQHEACFLHADQREGSTRLDLHGDVHVAIGSPVIARQRAEQREPPDAAGLKVGPAGARSTKALQARHQVLIISIIFNPPVMTLCPLGEEPVSNIVCQYRYVCFDPNTVSDNGLLTQSGNRAKFSIKFSMFDQS